MTDRENQQKPDAEIARQRLEQMVAEYKINPSPELAAAIANLVSALAD